MIKNDHTRTRPLASGIRLVIGAVHFAVFTAFTLVVVSGQLTLPAGLVWTAICAAADQAIVWALWLLGGRGEPGPNRGW